MTQAATEAVERTVFDRFDLMAVNKMACDSRWQDLSLSSVQVAMRHLGARVKATSFTILSRAASLGCTVSQKHSSLVERGWP